MSKVRELDLADFGLETVERAAARRGQNRATVRLWVAKGLLPAVVLGAGRTARYLVRPADVDAVPLRGKGRPPKGEGEGEPAPKPRKKKT